MKKLFTTFLVLLSAIAMNAQDSSNWKNGQEVTEEVGLQNTKFTGDQNGWNYFNAGGNGIGWFYEPEKCATGSIEMFNNAVGSETYQVIYLPAGYYKFTIQGFYRPGSAWSAGWDTNTDQNGIFFCDAVTLDEQETEDGELVTNYNVTKETNAKLQLIVADAYQGDEKILTDDMCGDWQRDNGFTKDGLQYWVPNSMWGTALYFDMGNYENELMVINAEDTYVKVGIRKGPGHIADDWIIFNNLRAYYISDAGEAVQLMLAQEELNKAEKAANDKSDAIIERYGSLGALLSDAIMEADIDASTVEGCKEAVKFYQDLIAEYDGYLAKAEELTALINKTSGLAEKNNDATLNAALEAARNVEQNGTGDNEMTIDSPTAYEEAINALINARTEFIKNFKNEAGYIDVTSFVSYPWFCLPQYEPTWSEEEQRWIPNEAVLNMENGTDRFDNGNLTHPKEEPWSALDDIDGTGANVAAGININSKKGTLGAWYQEGTEGGGLVLYWNDLLTCIKKWDMPHEGYHDVSQVVGGIPNGYYKLKALAQTWTNDWNGKCRNQIYIKSSTMESFSPYLEPGGWWGKDVNQWRELETEMIQVTDGQVLISSRDNGFAAFTGFRLYYYGETPDFTALLADALENAQNNAESLEWAGDKTAAQAILAKIPSPITNQEEYQTALDAITEVNDYVTKANNAMNQLNNNIIPGFDALVNQFAEGSKEADMASTAGLAAILLGDAETDTYLDALEAAKTLEAYKNYFSAYTQAKDYDNAELKAVLDKQATELIAEVANAEKLAEYMAEIAQPYNKAVLAALGADKATKDNPVDITTLIVNPKYDEDQKGWSGDNLTFNFDPSSVEKPHTAEKWNTNFDTYQTIYSLPAGNYRVQVQAIYRDGGAAQDAWKNWQAAAEEMELWDNQNAKVYANDNETSICSMASYKSTTRSMDSFRDKMVEAPEGDEQGNIVWLEHWNYQFKNEVTDPETGEVSYEELDEENGKTDWWWDNKIYSDLDEEYYFYPASLWGISQRFAKSPEAYINTVDVYIEEGGSIKLGIRKETLIGNDWVVMDNWKLFYLGADVPESINTVNGQSAVKNIYSVAGVRQNSLQKGINIVKTLDGKVSKVLVK